MAEVDNLWDLIPGCEAEDRVDGVVPVRDNVECRWKSEVIPTGTLTCTDVSNCMQTTINGINNTLNNHTNSINNLDNRVTNLEGYSHHTHSNLALLETLTNSGSPDFYLGEDGNYHQLPPYGSYYQTIQQGNVNAPQRTILAFSDDFQVTDDVANNRTIITFTGGASGGGTVTDDYVMSASYNQGTETLSLTRVSGAIVNVQITGASSDELVKIGNSGSPRYLNQNDFNDNGSDIEVKKQMSITSNNNGLMLNGDVVNPGNNMVYGTDASGNRGWIANTGIEVSFNVSSTTSSTLTHNLNKHPLPVCVDASGGLVQPYTVTYNNANTVTVTFTTAFTGTIYFS